MVLGVSAARPTLTFDHIRPLQFRDVERLFSRSVAFKKGHMQRPLGGI